MNLNSIDYIVFSTEEEKLEIRSLLESKGLDVHKYNQSEEHLHSYFCNEKGKWKMSYMGKNELDQLNNSYGRIKFKYVTAIALIREEKLKKLCQSTN